MLEFIRFEINYRLNRPVTYIYFALLMIMAFLSTSTDIVQAGGSGGKVMENSPVAVTAIMMVIMIFGVFIISALMGVPVLRDFEHKTDAMIFTTPAGKTNYLLGKFIGSFIITLLVISGILWGVVLGQAIPWPWHDYTDKLNPFSFGVYWNAFSVFLLPNLFIFSAIFFMGGTLGKRMVVVYAQGIVLFMGYLVASTFLSELDNQNMAALIDPFGFGAVSVTTQYWTVAEQNSNLFEFSGLILQNRLIWMLIGLLSLIFTLWRFNYDTVGNASTKVKKSGKTAQSVDHEKVMTPLVHQLFGRSAQWAQLKNLSWFYYRWIIKQGPFIFITIAGVAFIFLIAFVSGTGGYDIELYMTSNRAVGLIGIFNLFFIIITVFYTGELVWKERDVKMDLIYDALPYPNYISMASKFIGMVLMAITLLLALMFTGILIQFIKGYPTIEWNVYFTGLFTNTLAVMVLYVILGLFIQSVVNHKFLGFGLMFVFYISFIVMSELGIEHSMFYYARARLGGYSDMNNYGHYLTSFSWFNVYWFGFGAILYCIGILFTVRGIDTNFAIRLKLSKYRFNKSAAVAISAALLIFIVSGSFIFYNTNVLNKYQNSDDGKKDRADYEQTLKKYEFLTQPKIVDTYLEVELYPYQRDFDAKGHYILRNKSQDTIRQLHIQNSVDDQLTIVLDFDKATSVNEDFDKFRYTIYDLEQPMLSGDEIKLSFDAKFRTNGFKDGGSNTDVVYNGTFFNNSQYFPTLGYNSGFELSSDDDRKEQKMEPKERMMERNDPRGIANSLFGDDSDKISFEVIIGTVPEQIAIAPGYLQKQWEKDGRSYYHYKMDVPMVNFYSIVSADYEVIKDTWTPKGDSLPPVSLEIYHHKGHEYNTDRMMRGMKDALTYYSDNFSPYQFRQLRIMEFPAYRSFAQSFANTVPFSEAIGFIQQIKTSDVDLPYYVTAHEVAHQWWGHQVTEAGVKGNAMLSETLSQYSALMVMKQVFPPEIIKEFLKHELNSYLMGRTFEQKKEMPLDQVEGQGYIHYRKGSLIMFALQDYIGEENVNLALRRFVNDWGFKDAPYPTSADLIGYYRDVTPDSLQYIITDMFETITLFENKTSAATYEITPDSLYRIKLTVDAIKYRADSLGKETSIPLNDWIDIGVLTEDEDGKDKIIYLKKYKIVAETTEIEITVNEKPTKAGLDPINKLIDRNPKDNLKKVEEAEKPS